MTITTQLGPPFFLELAKWYWISSVWAKGVTSLKCMIEKETLRCLVYTLFVMYFRSHGSRCVLSFVFRKWLPRLFTVHHSWDPSGAPGLHYPPNGVPRYHPYSGVSIHRTASSYHVYFLFDGLTRGILRTPASDVHWTTENGQKQWKIAKFC